MKLHVFDPIASRQQVTSHLVLLLSDQHTSLLLKEKHDEVKSFFSVCLNVNINHGNPFHLKQQL